MWGSHVWAPGPGAQLWSPTKGKNLYDGVLLWGLFSVSELADNLSRQILGPNLPINGRSLGSSSLVT